MSKGNAKISKVVVLMDPESKAPVTCEGQDLLCSVEKFLKVPQTHFANP